MFNGLAPLSVRLIEIMIRQRGFANIKKQLNLLQGAPFFPPNEAEFFAMPKKKKILVYYVGGVTYAEIAAIRLLNKLFTDTKFVIATT